MAGAADEKPDEFNMFYVNLPEESGRTPAGNEGSHAAPDPGRKLFKLVGVGLGLLCILQAALNVSLRLTLFKSDTQPSPTETVCRNETDKQRQLIGHYIQRGWLYFHTSLYYISVNTTTWQESREFCLQHEADLVIINTKEEQDFTRQFHRHTWLGLRNVTKSGKWTWVDGTLLTKSYWGDGEPNNYKGTNEGCVEIKFFAFENSWNDTPCNDQNFWICERMVVL
ncbi:CD209 antigen-like protein E [Fundulus heteroclitus]|uniref:CD209 antigen-like protein E n=1 Tax=Fundulus heteroclitus TaxID=8078 RepID=UPI00165A7F27|nr:CD209 antigen-like protein E [Fundulus heteroclitus]